MNFISGQRSPGKGRGSRRRDLCAALFGGKDRPRRQQAQPAQRLRMAALGALTVVERLAQQLIAAADAQHRRAACCQLEYSGLQPGLAQPQQVVHRVFGAGQNDQVRRAQLPHGLHVPHTQKRVLFQRHKIGKIGNMRQSQNNCVQRLDRAFALQPRRKRVLVLDVHPQVRHYAQHRQLCFFLQHRQTGAQNFYVAAEFIDDKPAYTRALVRLQQRHRAVQLRKDAAAVNVARQQNRRVHELCQPHVDNVVRLQVDLGGTARALDDDDVKFIGKAVVGTQNIGNQRLFAAEIFLCGHVAADLAVHDDLAAHIAARLEQDRVHPHIGFDARGLRLHDLCAAHFEAVPGHKAVQRHVLAFERRGFVAVLRKNAAERRAQQAFARAAHRALHHDALCPAHASTSRIIFNSCSFSFWVRTAVRYHVSSSPG